MVAIYSVLLLLLVVTSVFSLWSDFSYPRLVRDLAFFVGISAAFLQALSKRSLKVYFWLQRIKIWWHSDLVTTWWIAARFDGEYEPAELTGLLKFLRDESQFKFPVKLDYDGDREIQVEVGQTLTLRFTVDGPGESFHGLQSHVSVISKTMEVSYGHAKKKLDTQVIPVLSAIRDFLKPEQSSYELNVEFTEKNPFFAIYIAHLKPEQIGDFRVVLYPDRYSQSATRKDRAEISRNNVHLTSFSTDSLKQLALDFILLSPDLTLLSATKHDG